MTLTAKQQAAIAKAPAAQKQQLRNMYHQQQLNNGRPRAAQPAQGNGRRFIRAPPARAPPRPKARATPRFPQQAKATFPQNCLDPCCPTVVPTPLSEGRALPHTGIVRQSFNTDPNYLELIMIANGGNFGTVGVKLKLGAMGSYSGHQLFTIPTLSQSMDDGGPSSARAMKLGASLVNCSNVMKKGGRVTYLNTSQRLPGRVPLADQTADRKEFTDILHAVRNSPYSKVVTGDQLSNSLQLISHPIDQTNYNTFRPFRGAGDIGDLYDLMLCTGQYETLGSLLQRGMSTIVFIIEQTSQEQDYTMTVRASYYTRWPLTTVPGQSMTNIPTSSATHLNNMRDAAERHASVLQPVTAATNVGAI